MRHLRVGLMIGVKTMDYPYALRMGIQNTLEEAGHTLVSFCDRTPQLNVVGGVDYYRMAFQIASRMNLDAIIVPIGCVTAHLNVPLEQSVELLHYLDPKKTIVLEHAAEGFRSITKDNRPGMHECMRHLIETCHLTKIGFVSGPKQSKGAQERADIYFKEMSAHGLGVRPEMFTYGSFSGDCGPAIEKLLDDNPDLEAIACAADLIAYTAYEVCRSRGLTVASDIAITGFDDHDRSAHIDPPLSTVRMRAYDLGCMGAREAIRLAEGLPQKEFVLSSRFIARSSCGEDEDFGPTFSTKDHLNLTADHIINAIVDSSLTLAGPSVRREFTRAIRDLNSRAQDNFVRYHATHDERIHLFSSGSIDAILNGTFRNYLSLEGFHAVFLNLYESTQTIVEPEEREWLTHEFARLNMKVTRLIASEYQQKLLTRGNIEWTTFHLVGDSLVAGEDTSQAYRLIFSELGRLGVIEADIFLLSEAVRFMGTKGFALSDQLSYIGSISQGDICVYQEPIAVTVQEILDIVFRRYSASFVTVGALVAGPEVVGLCIIDSPELDPTSQLMCILNLGFALKHLMLVSESREMINLLNRHSLLMEEESQHDELTGLLNRRGFTNRIQGLMASHVGERGMLMYLDLDGLKYINDTYGHDAGDEAIYQTATILKSSIDGHGLVARLGGDEFVAYVINPTPERTASIISAITCTMEEVNESAHNLFTLSISHGESTFVITEETLKNYSRYLTEADEHLFEMKRARKQSRRYASKDV